ncbi:hypothetical protein [Dyadobacter sp. SG02]|uniref:hypothetical protein n=1 Tax=Dyadobacter sp. SG02 TaxID=1855291 RepID=UPI001160061A|nr:hypothetical protein [Dyadobacter sp. SG02]
MAHVKFLAALLLLCATLLSCAPRHEHPKPELAFRTGPAVFMKLGGVINTFTVIFDEFGPEPIEEYGIVYKFDDNVQENHPDLRNQKVAFDQPARQYSNDKIVNIGIPVGSHALGYRAYVKLKDGRVEYAVPIVVVF